MPDENNSYQTESLQHRAGKARGSKSKAVDRRYIDDKVGEQSGKQMHEQVEKFGGGRFGLILIDKGLVLGIITNQKAANAVQLASPTFVLCRDSVVREKSGADSNRTTDDPEAISFGWLVGLPETWIPLYRFSVNRAESQATTYLQIPVKSLCILPTTDGA